MGVPVHTLQYRSDNKLYKLQTAQTPLVRPRKYDEFDMDNYPLGTNAIVAVISYTVSFYGDLFSKVWWIELKVKMMCRMNAKIFWDNDNKWAIKCHHQTNCPNMIRICCSGIKDCELNLPTHKKRKYVRALYCGPCRETIGSRYGKAIHRSICEPLLLNACSPC